MFNENNCFIAIGLNLIGQFYACFPVVG